ncbi:MAG TPA: CBS domain-containing protein [Planctomycetaceae bacterium]|nr:CBS domain-containing protein [Planctomycetaceae bacterium]
MELKDVMSIQVEAISEDAPLTEAARRMAQEDIGFLPVIGSDRISGVVTDRDIVIRCIAEGADPTMAAVKSAMTRDVAILPDAADVTEAAELMEQRQIRRILVQDEQGRYVGVVSLGDLARATEHELSGEVLQKVSEPAAPAARR